MYRKGRIIDPKGRIIDPKGRIIDPKGRIIDPTYYFIFNKKLNIIMILL